MDTKPTTVLQANAPANELFGIFPMIIGSIYVTAGAIIFGVPIGILTSVFMAMYCPKKIYRPLKAATELLAGIPSVVYGFFGMVIVVPIIRDFGRTLKMMGLVEKSGDGKGILEKGNVDALIVQNPYAMGYLGIEQINTLLNGQKPEKKETATSSILVTRENMYDDKSQKALFSFEEK